MNKSIILVSGILLLFLLNITLYSQSENYRFFVKKIKNRDAVIYTDNENISDIDKNEELVEGKIIKKPIIEQTFEEKEILEQATIVSRS